MIEIKFRCCCMTEDQPLHVRWREPTEDVAVWMETIVLPAVGDTHRDVSPRCRSQYITSLMIPLNEESAGIGMKPEPRAMTIGFVKLPHTHDFTYRMITGLDLSTGSPSPTVQSRQCACGASERMQVYLGRKE